MKISKKQKGGYVAQRDNTRVVRPIIKEKIKLTPEQLQKIQQRKLRELFKKNQAYIYDADKAKYYRNLQNFYNYNAFGYGLQGRPTRFDPSTPEGQRAISSTFNYARGNALDFLTSVSGVGISSGIGKVGRKASQAYSRLTKGVFPSRNGALGTLKQYAKNPIGGGAEAIVIENTPTTVGKITSIPVEEMAARNSIPNTIKSKYIGYIKDRKIKLPTYIQQKVKVLTEETFPKYVDKLDKARGRSGVTKGNDPNFQYRAYTNGKVVVDDVAPGNVGLTTGNPWLDKLIPDFIKSPRIIDSSYQTVPEWTAMGFKLKKGGKL